MLVGQLLHVLSIALVDGALIEVSGGDDPFSRASILFSHSHDVGQSGLPSLDYLEHY